jgi:mannose-1-phosphate guanylyltransferase
MNMHQKEPIVITYPLRCGIVLAGGEGKRLRSFVYRVRGSLIPKQYVNFIGSRSMLEHTFHRAEKLIHRNRLFTVITQNHLKYPEVRRQLSESSKDTIVVQPENKETAPGILLPLIQLYKRYPESTVVIFPSDHFIVEENLFMMHVYLAFRLVDRDPSRLVLLGIEPSDPEQDYGYILPGEKLTAPRLLNAHAVSKFIEKPGLNLVSSLIREGGLWNTMVMVFKPRMLLDRFRQTAAALYHAFERVNEALGEPFFPKIVEEVYRQIQPLNFSKSILEPLAKQEPSCLAVLPVRGVHWSDWGSEQRIADTLRPRCDPGFEEAPLAYPLGMAKISPSN